MTRSVRSESTASDASFELERKDVYEEASPAFSPYHDDALSSGANGRVARYPQGLSPRGGMRLGNDEDDDEEERLDEEEQVGLMQKDRRQISEHDLTKTPLQRLLQRRRGFIITAAVLSGLTLLIPLLTWLASSHRTPWSEIELTIPGPAIAVPQIAAVPSAKKFAPSSNDASGRFGLKNAQGFIFREEVSGWSTPAKADQRNGYPAGTTKTELTKQGWKNKGLKPVTMDEIFNGTFSHSVEDLNWSAEDPDVGVFATKDPGTWNIVLEDVTHARKERTGEGEIAKGGGKVIYVHGKDVKDAKGNPLRWSSFKASPDMSHVLFFADTRSVWRHSKRHNVYVHDVLAKRTYALGDGPTYPPNIAHAAWVPNTSASVAYVQQNNLFVALNPKSATHRPIQVTNDGTDTIFNAVTDWTYEEEVFATDHALWFSPNGTRFTYLRFDETKVPVYEYPIYNNDNGHAGKAPANPYNKWIQMKYPKPGFANPVVTAHMVDVEDLRNSNRVPGFSSSQVFELQSPSDGGDAVDIALAGDERARESRLITEVAWLDEDHVFLRETNRVSDKMRGVIFDTRKSARNNGLSLKGRVVRRQDAGNKSWIEATQDLVTIDRRDSSAYLDIVADVKGHRHVAYFADASTSEPAFLTRGEWEVDRIDHVDVKRGKVYFSAGYPLPYRRHVLSVDLPSGGVAAGAAPAEVGKGIVDLNAAHPSESFSVNFDPKGAYYVLQSQGPNLPSSEVVGVDDPSFRLVLANNREARATSAQHVKAQHVYYEVTMPDGVTTTTVQEIRPHDFDASGRVRYPVLFNVYGGPNSQKVTHDWRRTDWHEFVANQLGYVVAVVDGRGTGFRGKDYRDAVTGKMGSVEVDDLLSTARAIRSLPYVDEKRLGLWGWSYGGYLTTKAIEADARVLNLGMAIAPVTNWLFYDSIYTERYMKEADSASGHERYENSSVHVTDGFRRAHFLLAQGSGDDNVHFQNSAHLIDMLTANHVHGYEFKMYTDSSHSIATRGAYRELHEFMSDFLKRKWGAGGKRRFAGKKGVKGDADLHGAAVHGSMG